MSISVLNGAMYATMVKNGAANLNLNRAYVNELNVFPVPDGDTGDNMYLTIVSGGNVVEKDAGDHLGEVSDKAARAMMLGARGNSGVILSRIFAGIAESLAKEPAADVRILGRSFKDGIASAYGAVSHPVEGTILSVYRDAVNYANERITEESTINSYFVDFLCELRESLKRTPDLLPILKEAGVVDSGGQGFVYIAEGMAKALNGEIIDDQAEKPGAAAQEEPDLDAFTEDSELTYGYCTEFLLRLQHKKCDVEQFDLEALKAYLNSVGDSVVSYQTGSIVKVHVHTMTPGEVLNHCQHYGEYLKLKIENMNLQHNETESAKEEERHVKFHKRYGIVTVANGDGIINLFKDLGADEVVNGGQSMNPSAESFVEAFDRIDCDEIIVFPNNSNIVMTAEQAGVLYEKIPVHVVKTRNIGEGYAALSMMDTTQKDVEMLLQEARESIEGVATGMVSKATRDAVMNGVSVHGDDYIGFSGDIILTDDPDPNTAALRLAEGMNAGDYDILLLIRGKNVTEEQANALKETLSATYKRTDIYAVDGLQPVYDYILVLQ